MEEPQSLEQALRETEARVAFLERHAGRRAALFARGKGLQAALINHRRLAQHRGVPLWEAAQRGAMRMLVLAIGCGVLITGAAALDATLSGVAIVIAFGVLIYEGQR